MTYYINLFSPETYEAFTHSDRTVSGFRIKHHGLVAKLKTGDILVCYITRLSRWCGLLEVIDNCPFQDNTPIFVENNDPFILRFHVRTKVWLSLSDSIPIRDDKIWQHLSFTQSYPKNSGIWTGILRNSLNKLNDKDGELLAEMLSMQANNPFPYPLDEKELKNLKKHTVNRVEKVVEVSVPENEESLENNEICINNDVRESIKMQALLAQIGACMGHRIWLPKADRSRVLKEWKKDTEALLDRLPLNYDETTLSTIEQIDVIWLKGRSIIRAFEIEQTTSVYSGLLRMADLLALQPNMNIKLHIVAPDYRQEKVFQEILRPVFSLLEKGPLSESCSYISYSKLKELSKQKHLDRMNDGVLDDYDEQAEL